MSYIDGFVIAVPTANKDSFITHATTGDAMFMEFGATRVVETWGDNVPKGHTTDFQGAVAAKDDESIVFSWIEWPDKATRDACMAKMMAPDFKDERMDPEKNPMPFDGARMIFGGFQPIVSHGQPNDGDYVQGFIVPVHENRQEDYRKVADQAWKMFERFGATSVVEAWSDDVPEGKQTDFFRAVRAEPDERVVFSFMTWPDRETCDEASARMQSEGDTDPELAAMAMPFDGKRMVWGGFEPVLVLGGK